MKIAMLGTGVVAQILAEKLASLNHEVFIGTRNVDETLARTGQDNFGRPPFGEWKKDHPGIGFGTFSEAAGFGELVINATNGMGSLRALEQAGKQNLSGKVLLDASNPLDFSKGLPPSLFISNTDSLGEQIQQLLPDTHVVKTLNTVNAYIMVNPALLGDDHSLFLSGNSTDAKNQVRELLVSFGWKPAYLIDLGDITTARGTEQYLPLWVRIWLGTQNPMFNIKVVFGNIG
jgi:8-hydroxy-5-deazaflavin:NADPH oxidoreductase